MNFYNPSFFHCRSLAISSFALGLLGLLVGCTSGGEKQNEQSTVHEPSGVVEIVTNALEIQMPDTLLSGWTTLNYRNNSQMTHLLLFEHYPMYEGKQLTVDDAKNLVVPTFQAIMDSLNSGGEPPYDRLPPWFEQVKFLGGVGLIGPQKTANTIINLNPGYYVVECYVKNPGGQFHSSAGMIVGVVVADKSTGLAAPQADVQVTISSTDGIEMPGPVSAGRRTFAVQYQDQAAQENFVGFDINLVKLENDTDIESLQKWMNWMLPEGLQIPAPATFLGGTQEMPGGNTAYFTATLETGRYALISEVPDSQAKGMYLEFEVTE